MRPKTKEEKEMQGTFEPSKEAPEPMYLSEWDGERLPASPGGWPTSIQSIWNDRCRDLKNTGYLTKAFLPLLRRYCFAILQAEKAESQLISEGFVTFERGSEGQEYEVVSKWVMCWITRIRLSKGLGQSLASPRLMFKRYPQFRRRKEKR